MTDELVEKVARAIFNARLMTMDVAVDSARAALTAIEAAGWAVVKLDKPTTEELQSALQAAEYKYFGDYPLSDGQWDAVGTMLAATRVLLSARPPIGGEKV